MNIKAALSKDVKAYIVAVPCNVFTWTIHLIKTPYNIRILKGFP